MSNLIVVDAGHGGYDLGATFEGRLEKDDNLRLAQAVARELRAMGQEVIMTRDSDVFVSLADRARIANNANADLFVSLHRNSFEMQTPDSKGVENYIYLSAPEQTQQYAENVLDSVVEVGVQADNGVKRANFYVLRETNMPAMLLEMGYIINAEDNRLFDQNLDAYAKAIAEGIIQSLGQSGGETDYEDTSNWTETIRGIQKILNERYHAGIAADGIYGPVTRNALIRAIQTTLNEDYGANIAVDGIFGPVTLSYIPNLKKGTTEALVTLLQSLLFVNGYNPGPIDGVFGPKTEDAVKRFQRDNGLVQDGIAGKQTFLSLLY